jgi:phosphoserine phosphatase RsbU/P
MADLNVLTAVGPGGRVPVTGRRMLIGRAEESDVFLLDTMLSRRHAELEQRDDGFYLVDLGSTNGTFVNGERVVGERRLRNGDMIALGDTRLLFSDAEPPTEDDLPLEGAQAFALRDLRSRTTVQAMFQQDPDPQARLVRLMSKATSSLLGHRSLPELFERVLDVIFESIPVDRAAIMLIDENGKREIRASRSRLGSPEIRISNTIARKVIEQRLALICPNVLEDPSLCFQDSVILPGTLSAMCAPLWLSPSQGAPEEVIGLVYADATSTVQPFGESELEILTAFGNLAASKIESTRLMMRSRDRDRLASEIEAAVEIQRSILPTHAPVVPGCELAGESRSCEAVGGDYHDYDWDGQRLLLTLADVAGKGLGAAMLMSALRSAVRAHWREPSLANAASLINRTFFENVPSDRYATCFLAQYDPSTGQLDYLNAGHPPALLVRANGTVERLEPSGPGLALFDAGVFEARIARLGSGDTLLVYSDGISEAWATAEEAEAILADVVRSAAERPIEQLRSEVFAAADDRRGRERSDDCTLVLLRRQGHSEQSSPTPGRAARVWRSNEG